MLSDMATFCDLQMDPEVGRHLSWLPMARSQCESALLDAIAQQAAAERVRFFFAVDLLTVGEMIGTVGYTKSTSATGECGWFLRRQFWGHGYASEAVRELVELAHADDQLERLTASCRLKNVASLRVAEACGFKRSAASDERVYFELAVRRIAPN